MIERNSKAIDLSSNSNASYVQAGGGYTGAKVERVIGDGGAGANAGLLQSILGDVKKVMDTGVQTSRAEAYLAGAAKAATGEAEEALESSFTTKDWATAGYRDTSGKLKMADAESNLFKDMQHLRQQSPEKMAEYLAERRSKLAPSLDGMSREQRTAAFGQMLMSDRSAIATHAKEYAAFQVEQIVNVKQAEHSVAKAKLDAALKSGDESSYGIAMQDYAVGFIGGSIMAEPRFPPELKNKMAVQAIDDALGSGNVKLYEALRDTKQANNPHDPSAGESSILSRLSLEDQRKLSDSYRSAYNQTEGARELDMQNAIQFMKADMSAGTYTGGIESIYAMQAKLLKSNPNNGAQASALLTHFLTEKAKDHPNIPLIIARTVAGDFASLNAMNVEPSKALDYVEADWAKKGITPEQKVPLLLTMMGTGNKEVANKLGGVMDGIMRGIAFKSDTTPENQATMQKMVGYVEQLKADQKDAALAQVYAGMSEESAVRMQRLLAAGATSNPADAILQVREQEHQEANMSASDKADLQRNNSKVLNEYLANVSPLGTWERFKSYLPMVGVTREQAQLSPATSLWTKESDNPDITNASVVNTHTALREEMNTRSMQYRNTSPETLVKYAEQAVLRRTLMVGNTPIVVPQGKTPQEYFSIPGSKLVASPEQLSKAIEAVTPKGDKSGRFVYSINGDTIKATEYSEKGVATDRSYDIRREDVLKAVQWQQDKKIEATNEAHGVGIPVPLGTKTLTINGENTAAMSNENMATVRKNLVKFEGFTKGVQQDVGKMKDDKGNDVMTTGVGISSTNTYFKDAAAATTPEQHLEVFRKSSDEAARYAMQLNKKLNLRGDSWQVLLTELIYQSGVGNVTQLPSYQKLLTNRDPAMAVELLEKTPAFTMSQKSRQRHYRALIQSAALGE